MCKTHDIIYNIDLLEGFTDRVPTSFSLAFNNYWIYPYICAIYVLFYQTLPLAFVSPSFSFEAFPYVRCSIFPLTSTIMITMLFRTWAIKLPHKPQTLENAHDNRSCRNKLFTKFTIEKLLLFNHLINLKIIQLIVIKLNLIMYYLIVIYWLIFLLLKM